MRRALPLIFLSFTAGGGAYLFGSLSLSMGTLEQPGPGLFPVVVGIFILSLSIPGLLGSLKPKTIAPVQGSVFPRGKDLRRITFMILMVLFYSVSLPYLGYGICSALLMGAILRLLGMKSWGKIAATALLAALISFLIFVSLLDIPLPRGSLFS